MSSSTTTLGGIEHSRLPGNETQRMFTYSYPLFVIKSLPLRDADASSWPCADNRCPNAIAGPSEWMGLGVGIDPIDRDSPRSFASIPKTAGKQIAPLLEGNELVILESTSPPGATEFLADTIIAARPDLTLKPGTSQSIYFAHCPERVLPGRIMIELRTNDRIVGTLNGNAGERAPDLYQLFCEGEFLMTDACTAELSKLTENAYRDVNIAFANELSMIADNLDINVWELIDLANHHPRVNILQPGPGVGGHCIAVDPWFIVATTPEHSSLIKTAREVNDSKPQFVLDKLLPQAKRIKDVRIAALGLAFKPNIDDLRESPARQIVNQLSDELPEATIMAVEPNIDQLPSDLANRDNVALTELNAAVKEADIVLLLVDHNEFARIDRSLLAQKIVHDTRGVWN